MIIVNFKTYLEATGEKAVELASICQEAAEETGVKIVIGLQAADIFRVASQIKIPIFSQHADNVEPGKNTGKTTILAVKRAGATGVMLNHSENHFFHFADLGQAIQLAKKAGLQTLVFAKDKAISVKIDHFQPDFIALEKPTFIASGQPMISKPQYQQLIRQFIQAVKAKPLIGAGITTREDVFQCLKIGIKGVVVSSAVVQAANPKQVLLSLASAFQ